MAKWNKDARVGLRVQGLGEVVPRFKQNSNKCRAHPMYLDTLGRL